MTWLEEMREKEKVKLYIGTVESFDDVNDVLSVNIDGSVLNIPSPEWFYVTLPAHSITIPAQSVTDSGGDTVDIPEQTVPAADIVMKVVDPTALVGKKVVVVYREATNEFSLVGLL